MTVPRKGQAPAPLDRNEFHLEFRKSFLDPAFGGVATQLDAVEEIAWVNYKDGHKAPLTEKAGAGFADPDYDLSVEWKATRDRLIAAEISQKATATRSRVLLICSSARNDGSCPGEISKTWRLTLIAQEILEHAGIEVDLLDLSRLISDYDRHIHPCRAVHRRRCRCVIGRAAAIRITASVRPTTGWRRFMKNGSPHMG